MSPVLAKSMNWRLIGWIYLSLEQKGKSQRKQNLWGNSMEFCKNMFNYSCLLLLTDNLKNEPQENTRTLRCQDRNSLLSERSEASWCDRQLTNLENPGRFCRNKWFFFLIPPIEKTELEGLTKSFILLCILWVINMYYFCLVHPL